MAMQVGGVADEEIETETETEIARETVRDHLVVMEVL
jgi:hypothetical protein